MRVLCVIDHFGSGGAQRQLVTLAVGLAERGHKVEFFIYHPSHTHLASIVEEAALVVHAHPKVSRFSPSVVMALRRLTVKQRYDIVLAFLNTPNVYVEILKALGSQTPVVVSERSMFAPGRLGLSTWLQQNLHRLADHIVVNSHHQRLRMEKRFPWMESKISTITNGVELARFRPPLHEPKREGFSMLAVGAIHSTKNMVGLIEGLRSYVANYGESPAVSWAGRLLPYSAAQQVYQDACARIVHYGLEPYWTWLGERKDIPDLIRHHDVVVHPSFLEGFPNAICEGLASGRAVLASDVLDHPRLVQEGLTGYLFDPHQPEDIASAIHKWVSLSYEERMRMNRSARAFAEEHLSTDLYVQRFETLFRNVCKEASRSASEVYG